MGVSLNLIADADAVLYNRRVKVNPLNGEVLEDVCASRPIFNPTGAVRLDRERKKHGAVETRDRESDCEPGEAAGGADGGDQTDENGGAAAAGSRAASRARKQLFELCACNDLDLFFTLTINPEVIDSYDYAAVIKRFGQWADNRVRRRGLRYVAVPELHKSGRLHLHGLCNSAACRLVDSGKTDKGHKIYNLSDWDYGFTTAIFLYGERNAAAHYIAKYVTKTTESGKIAGRYFYHGGDLNMARCHYYHADWNAFEGKTFDVEAAGLTFKYAGR